MYTYLIFDTNVLFGLLTGDNENFAIKQVMNYYNNNYIVPIYNDEIIEEYNIIFSLLRFNINQEDKDSLLSDIKQNGIKFTPIKSNDEIPDENDRIFYDTLTQCPYKPLYLVSKNRKDFYMLKKRSITVGRCLTILENTYGLLEENKEIEKKKADRKMQQRKQKLEK